MLFLALLPGLVSFLIIGKIEDYKEAIEKIEKEREKERNALENLNLEYGKLSR